MTPQRTHLDLFSGIGGFAIAAQRCGYTTVGFCEKELYAQHILKERFGAVLADAMCDRLNSGENTGTTDRRSEENEWSLGKGFEHRKVGRPSLHPDIFTLNGADYAGVDLLTGGFPCQPFSVAGQRRGKEDDRAIWPEMLRVIDEAQPTWIIGENVAGIVTMELDNILSDLEAIGYSAWPIVVPACAVDARHRRDRVWIIGRRDVADSDRSSIKRKQLTSRVGKENAEHQQHGGRFPQSSVRRVADGLPEGLDGGGTFCQWTEEDPGTPRVSTGVKHRAHRLRGLGNAIVGKVAEEIIRSIVLVSH